MRFSRKHTPLAALSLAAFIAAPAAAQNETPAPPPPLVFEEDVVPIPDDTTLAPATRTTPAVAPPFVPAGDELDTAAPRAPLAPALTEEQQAARSAQINQNYDETLDIYGSILDRQDTDTTMLDRRIETNEQLIERYQPKLAESEQKLRSAQVEFRNRVLALKRQHDEGRLGDEEFKEAVVKERDRYERRIARHQGDAGFYRTENAEAAKRLEVLGKERETKARELALREANKPKPKDPTVDLVDGLFGQLDQLAGFRVRFTMDGTSGFHRYDHMHGSE